MTHPSFRSDIGPTLQRLLNGLKHTPETLGPVIHIDPSILQGIIDGAIPFSPEIESKLLQLPIINRSEFYAESEQHLFPPKNDTNMGAAFCSATQRSATERTISRGPSIPFYTYADTAMSCQSTFRPEWIQQLCVHSGNDADLPDWAFNKGHFEHQITYFIGPVNFYWIDKNGRRHVRKMHTGDVNYITPFVPHTFTTREQERGLILAVTYGGALSLPEVRAQIQRKTLDEFLAGARAYANDTEQEQNSLFAQGVLFAEPAHQPVLGLVDRIQPPHQPSTRASELSLNQTHATHSSSIAGDRWIYNTGSTPARISWSSKHVLLDPGSSIVLLPGVEHTLSLETPSASANLLMVDIQPRIEDSDRELRLIGLYAGEQGLRRVHTEHTRWY